MSSRDSRSIREQALPGQLEYLHQTFLKVPELLDKEDIALLREHDLITGTQADTAISAGKEMDDKLVTPLTVDRYSLSIDEYLKRHDRKLIEEFDNRMPMVADWRPEFPEIFNETFVEFILSTHKRFCDMAPNREFYAYIMQSRKWMQDPNHLTPKNTVWELDQYRKMEQARCKANTMYFADRYGRIKDGDPEEGTDIYVSNLAHAQMFFLFDQQRSQFEAKVRQMASSTSKGLMHAKTAAFIPGRLQVMIANDGESGNGLLEDKVKWPFEALPEWLRPKVMNTPEGYFRVTFRPDGTLSKRKSESADIEVRTPSITAINSRKPKVITVDEASFIAQFEAMMIEARPVLFRYKPHLGRRVMDGQLIAFSTGGRSTSGNASYEREYRGEVEKWHNRDYSGCIVPTLYDWTCQPGIDTTFYLREMKAYMAGTKQGHSALSIQERMTQFRQHYPSSIEDVFLTSKATLIPQSILLGDIDRARKADAQGLSVSYGRFEPVYGPTIMPPGSPFKRNIINATWHPMGDDRLAPVQLWIHPDHSYVDRNYQGTDPIQMDIGLSNMASAMWDAHFGTWACFVNMRTMDVMDSYLQCILMGLYYGNGKFVPELVEVDMGVDYMRVKSGPVFNGEKSLVGQWKLPEFLQGRAPSGGSGKPDMLLRRGISAKGGNKNRVIELVKDSYMSHHRNWYHHDLFAQHLHFVGTPTKGMNPGTRWASEDPAKFQDDMIMASGYGYLCRLCFPNKIPARLDGKAAARRVKPTERLVVVETPFGRQVIRQRA